MHSNKSSSSTSSTLLSSNRSKSAEEIFTIHGKEACESQDQLLTAFLKQLAKSEKVSTLSKEVLLGCLMDKAGTLSHKAHCVLFLALQETEGKNKITQIIRSLTNARQDQEGMKNFCFSPLFLILIPLCTPEQISALPSPPDLEQKQAPRELSSLNYQTLFAELDHDRWKTRSAACTSLSALIPSLTDAEHHALFDKLGTISREDDDLDVCINACKTLVSLGLQLQDMQKIRSIIDKLYEAFDHMESLDEIAYDPDQSWVIPQIACQTLGPLSIRLKGTKNEEDILTRLYSGLVHENWHVRQAALESLMQVENPKPVETSADSSVELLVYSLFSEALRPENRVGLPADFKF
jgi:hypothetical protein